MKTTPFFTREDYMNKKCSHMEYYSQYVNASRKEIVLRYITKEKILASRKSSFNDIPLDLWDRLPITFSPSELSSRGEVFCLSTKVCVAKAIARMIRDEALVAAE